VLHLRITLVVLNIAAQTKLEIRSWLGRGIICSFTNSRLSKQEKKLRFTSFMNYYITVRSNLKYVVGIAMAGLKYNTCSDLLRRKFKNVTGIHSNINI
jgi:hypothetical protein